MAYLDLGTSLDALLQARTDFIVKCFLGNIQPLCVRSRVDILRLASKHGDGRWGQGGGAHVDEPIGNVRELRINIADHVHPGFILSRT